MANTMTPQRTKRQHTIIIAEAGVNHNGSLKNALKLVDAAARAGADFVKFQTFRATHLATENAPKAEYQKRTTGRQQSQLDMLRQLELSPAAHRTLIEHCKKRKIRFLSTPFDIESLDFLTKDLKLGVIKIPSSEITNPLLLLKAAQNGCKLIVSTGMATITEIEEALGVIAFGYLALKSKPSRAAFKRAYRNPKASALLKKNVTLLHCTTEYPAPFEDVNLRAMETMAKVFGLPVGYSDHTPGIAVSIAAAACGAMMIEKHITLDCSLPGPDHRASTEPEEFAALVQGVREIEMALGDGRKICRPSEKKNRAIARKSLFAAAAIPKGTAFTAQNVAVMRPVTGLSSAYYWDILGTKAKRALKKGDPIKR